MLSNLKSITQRYYRGLFKDKTEAIIFNVAFILVMSIGLYYVYRWGATYVSIGDCLAHLYIARAVIDNGVNSGLAQLGTVWLPVFHLLLVPFVAIDVLYTTGLAGTIVNGLMVAGISVMVYRLLDNKRLGILASALFIANPYTLLLCGPSVWMPPAGMFFALLATYHFKLYLERDDVREFMKCSLALIIGTLTRYEVWPISILVMIFFILREIRNGQSYRVSYVHFPLWGIFAWFFYNIAIFRDPLISIWGPFPGAGSYYSGVIERILHPTLDRAVNYGFPSLIMLAGYIWLFLAVALLLPLFRRNWKTMAIVMLLTAPIILFFQVGGDNKISIANLYFSLPGIILSCFFITKLVKSSFPARILKALFIISLTVSYVVTLPHQYAYLTSFPSPYYLPNPEAAIEKYHEMRSESFLIKSTIGQGSYILASSRGSATSGRMLSVLGGVSPAKIIDEWDGILFAKASKEPWKYCKYVIIDKVSFLIRWISKESLKAQNDYYGGHFLYLYYYDPQWHQDFLNNYVLILETANFFVYQRLEV